MSRIVATCGGLVFLDPFGHGDAALREGARARRFTDAADAEHFLRGLLGDPWAVQGLRGLLLACEGSVFASLTDDDKVVRRIAALLACGSLLVVERAALAPRPPTPAPVAVGEKAQTDAPPADPPPADPAKSQERTQVPMEWRLAFSDGPAVGGFKSRFSDGGQPRMLDPDGQGHHKLEGYYRNDAYTVTPLGQIEVTAKLKTHDDHPIPDAVLLLEPAYGESAELTTDGGGAIRAEGFVKQEELEVTVLRGGQAIAGKFVDADERPLAGVRARLQRDWMDDQEIASGADGSFELAGCVLGTGFALTLLPGGGRVEGRFVDEICKPGAGVRARIDWDDGGAAEVVSDGDGFSRTLA